MDEMMRHDEGRDVYTRQPSKPVEDSLEDRRDDEAGVQKSPESARALRSLTDRERIERWPIG